MVMATGLLVLLLHGCERQQQEPQTIANASEDIQLEDEVRQSMKSLSDWLNCPRRWEAGQLVISNICAKVRKIGDPIARRRCVSSYTNIVRNLEFTIDAPLGAKDLSRVIGINLASYYELIECGFSMLCENDSMKPDMWDFFLESPRKYKTALTIRTDHLETAGMPANRFRSDALYNELKDGLQNCSRIIESGWYPSAKRRMTPQQLIEVRAKIKATLGYLPPGIEKDEMVERTKDLGMGR